MCGGDLLRLSLSGVAGGGVFQRRSPRCAADDRAEPARGVVGVGGDLCAGGGVVSVHDAGVHCDDGGAAGERMWGNGEAVRGRSEGETDVLREGLEETGDSGSAGGGAERDYVRGAVL